MSNVFYTCINSVGNDKKLLLLKQQVPGIFCRTGKAHSCPLLSPQYSQVGIVHTGQFLEAWYMKLYFLATKKLIIRWNHKKKKWKTKHAHGHY